MFNFEVIALAPIAVDPDFFGSNEKRETAPEKNQN
jgi:hypothetical protein